MTTLPIPKEVLTQHVAVLGKTRSGKSSVMRVLVERLLNDGKPVCIVDPKGDWYGIKLAADGKRPGFPVVIFGGEHADIPINEHAGAHVAELFATGNRPCLIDLGGWMVGARTRFWIDFSSSLFRHTRGARWLVVDEIHNFAPKGKIFDVEAGKMLHWTNRLASEGLGKGIAMVFASQRPQKVHNDTLTSAETLIAMRVLHPSDRGAVSEWIKGCGDSEGSEVLGTLAQMARGEAWVWSPEIGFGPKRVTFPMFKTYDSFRPQTVSDARRLKGWAEVDLDEVRAKLATVVEQAKANDPKELRKEIVELQRQLKDKHTAARGSTDVAKASVRETIIEKSVLKDGQLVRAERLVEQTVAKIVWFHDRLQKAIESVEVKTDKSLTDLRAIVDSITAAIEQTRQPVPAMSPPIIMSPRPQGPTRPTASATQQLVTSDNGHRREPHQRVLNSLAWWEAAGIGQPSRHQVAFGARYSVNGNFNNLLGQLRSDGLIEYPAGNHVALTDTGRAVTTAPDHPAGRDGLAEMVLRVLRKEPQRRVFMAVVRTSQDMSREDLAAACNYSVNGNFNNILGTLRSLGVITYPRGNHVSLGSMFDI